MLTSIDVKFLSSTAYFSSSSEDILQTLFFISVFFILFSFNLIKVLKILLNVSLQRINNCPVSGLYFDSRRINELYVFSSRLSFIVSMFIAHVTELVHRSTSIYVSTTLSIQNIRLLLYYVGFQNDFSYSDWNASRK